MLNERNVADTESTMIINLKKSTRGRFRLTMLGTGSAFTVGDDNYQSNFLLEDLNSKRKLLLDCGSDARFSLHAVGLSATDITDVYVSHPHADHIGGLEWMAFATKFIPNHPKPNLILSKRFVSDLWSKSLAGGLESIEGEIADMDGYFNVQAVGVKGRFEWQGIHFQLVQVVHVMNGFDIVHSYGLMFKINETTIFFTSDTQFAPNQLTKFYNMADLILHDCETSPCKSGVHAHYSDLNKLPPATKAKMILYHYQPGPKPNAVDDGFQAWGERGRQLIFV